MTTQEAVQLLRSHNAWRTEQGGFAHSPAQITQAIDHVCDVLQRLDVAVSSVGNQFRYNGEVWWALMRKDRKDWPNA